MAQLRHSASLHHLQYLRGSFLLLVNASAREIEKSKGQKFVSAVDRMYKGSPLWLY